MFLNHAQKLAVKSKSPRIAVIAAAGSGKTHVLIERIYDLVKIRGVNPAVIKPITFTRKAAGELRERLTKMGITEVRADTFHSFCYAMINGYATRLGYRFPVNAYDEHLSNSILVDIMLSYNLPYGKPIKNESLRAASTRVVRNAVKKIYDKKPDEWIRIDEEYHHRLKTYNAVDYSMMIRETVRLLSEHQDVRSQIHNNYHHFMVDEFQDTDPEQLALIDLIDPKNLFIIGDPDQSIYSWRSARPENLNMVASRPGCEIINLNINYRCASKIIERSNQLIKHIPNPLRIDAVPTNDAVDGTCQSRGTQVESWTHAATLTRDLLKRFRPNEIAILCRDNGRDYYPVGCYGVAEALKAAGIPFKRIIRDGTIWESTEVRNIIYTLNLILNPRDRASWSKAIDFPFRRTSQEGRTEIRRKATHERLTLLEASLDYNTEVNKWAKSIIELQEYYLKIGLHSDNCIEFFELVTKKMCWVQYFYPLIGRKINILLQRIRLQMKTLNEAGLTEIQDFLEWWLSREAIDEMPNMNAVEISTIHSYKGLEKRVVIIPGLDSGFPKLSKKNLNLDEEVRIFYVALTRAEEECYVLYQNESSQFVDWAGFYDIEKEETDENEDFVQ